MLSNIQKAGVSLVVAAVVIGLMTVKASQATAPAPIIPPPPAPPNAFQDGTSLIAPEYIRWMALEYKVDPAMALYIAEHESHFDTRAIGDHGQSYGAWQINRYYNPGVSVACAHDPECSTDWTMKQLAAGKANLWSTWRFRK